MDTRRNDQIKEDEQVTPAIGLIATATNASAMARTVLRARYHELEPIVYPNCPSECESLRFARQLDATVLEASITEVTASDPKRHLVNAAIDSGYPGLIFAADPTEPIDFERSVEGLNNRSRFVIDAITDRSITRGDVLLGIPAYNESETIADVIKEALTVVDSVLVVDDGSSDDTASAARTAGADVVCHSRNRGYGAALKTIFSYADRWNVLELVVLDGDGQHDARDVSRLLNHRREHDHDVVIGSRFVEGASGHVPLLRRVGIRTVNLLTNVVLWSSRSRFSVSDAQSGFRAYGSAAIEVLANSKRIGDGMASSTDVLFVCASSGLSVSEVGIEINYEVNDPNTHHPASHGLALVQNIIRIVETEYPIRLLGIPGLILLVVGLGFGYWTSVNYLSTTTFPMGLAITATLFSLAGVLTMFTSIILHALNLHSLSNTR